MTWLIGIIIFLIGAAIGCIATRFIPVLSGKSQQLEAELDKHIKAQETFKKDVDHYLASVNQAMQSIAEQATQAAAESQQNFSRIAETQKENKEYVPFFGYETSEMLTKSQPVVSLSKKLNEGQAKSIPLDYSENKMGWFEAEAKK